MQTELIFQAANMFALIGWVILIFLPRWQASEKIIIGIIITLLAFVYTYLLLSKFTLSDIGGFSSLQGVMTLFKNPYLLLAGWIHYLAFDLLAGIFITNNAARHMISHWLVIPCLLFTFLFGPFGLLLYLIVRLLKTKKYFAQNF